jgi:hypothetical protein
VHLVDDGNWTADDEPTPEDEQTQWHAGPVTMDENGDWVWNLIESPDLAEEWSNYQEYVPGGVYLN